MLHAIMQMLAGKEIPFPWDNKKSGIDGVESDPLPLDQFEDWYTTTQWKEVDACQIL